MKRNEAKKLKQKEAKQKIIVFVSQNEAKKKYTRKWDTLLPLIANFS